MTQREKKPTRTRLVSVPPNELLGEASTIFPKGSSDVALGDKRLMKTVPTGSWGKNDNM